MRALSEFVEVQPKSKIKAGEGLSCGKYKFFTSSNIQTKWLNESQYEKPALIFGTGGMPSVHYCETPFSTSTDCIVMYAKPGANLEVICRYLSANMQLLAEGFHGIGLQHISKKYILDIEIPELDEVKQKVVTEIANKLDMLIFLRKEQLEKLDQLVKSRFIELFGSQCHNEKNYPYGKIDDVAEIYLGLTHTPEYIETGVKFISAKNTSCDYLDLSDVKYISKKEYASAPAGAKPRKGDVIFSRVGSNLGHPVILDIDEELCTFVSLGYLRTKGRVTNLYLKHWMRDDFFAEQVRRKVVGGGQPNLNTGWLKEFRIIIPPMDIQEQFAAFVEQTDKSKLAIQQSLDKLETLKKSLMQEYFG